MICFTVHGEPQAQGSMVAFMPNGGKRPIMHAANSKELKAWRAEIGKMATLSLRGGSPAGRAVAVRVTVLFVFEPPKKSKYAECVKAPDLDKLVRALLDGMTSIVYEDDAQVTEIHASKEFGQEPRAEVFVEEVSRQAEMLRLAPPKDNELPF